MLAAVAKCSRCAAVVNTHWSTCLVCRAPVEAGSPPIEEVLLVDPPVPLTIAAGDRIEWTRADLTVQTGVVDFMHVDDTGARWAFVTLGESWAAVNMKFAQGSQA